MPQMTSPLRQHDSSATLKTRAQQWLAARVNKPPIRSRWPQRRRDIFALRPGYRVLLLHDWLDWHDCQRTVAEVVCAPRCCPGVEPLIVLTLRAADGRPLSLQFRRLQSAALLPGGETSGDTFVLLDADVEQSSRAWLIPLGDDVLQPASHCFLFRSAIVGEPRSAAWRRASVPDELWSIHQLAPAQVSAELSVRASLRDRGSRHHTLFVVHLKNAFPTLRELCRDVLLGDDDWCSPLHDAASPLGGLLTASAICKHLNRLINTVARFKDGKLLDSRTLSHSTELLLPDPHQAIFVVESGQRSGCGLPACGSVNFELSAPPAVRLDSIACQCGTQAVAVEPNTMVRLDWYRVSSPPLHKLSSGAWSLLRCQEDSGRSALKLAFVGTWTTGLNTTDVWIPNATFPSHSPVH